MESKIVKSDQRVVLTVEQVDAMLSEGNRVHTFKQLMGPATTLFGCDRSREGILKIAAEGKAELAGEIATSMNHGVVVFEEDGSALFCETKAEVPA